MFMQVENLYACLCTKESYELICFQIICILMIGVHIMHVYAYTVLCAFMLGKELCNVMRVRFLCDIMHLRLYVTL